MCPQERWFGIRRLDLFISLPTSFLNCFPSCPSVDEWSKVCRVLHPWPFLEVKGYRESSAGRGATKPPIPILFSDQLLVPHPQNEGPADLAGWWGTVRRRINMAQAPVTKLSHHAPFHAVLFILPSELAETSFPVSKSWSPNCFVRSPHSC